MRLSIVTTLYNSAPYLEEFHKRISKSAQTITPDYEIILVNDGSPDDSLEKALTLRSADDRVKIIDLSRNFGHHKAMMTGLAHASGEYVFLIDSDLEEPPELLERFWKELQESPETDVVFGVQETRRGNLFERMSGYLFYTVVNFLSEVKIPRNFLTVRLMTQRYNRELVKFEEREINFSTLTELAGFEKKPVEVKKGHHSSSNYSLIRKLSILVNAVTSSTNRPLWLIFYLGLMITAFSLGYILYLVFLRLFFGVGVEGWTSVIVSVFFFGGLIIFLLGIIGIYLSKIFVETKSRPYIVIRQIYGLERKY